MITLNLKNIQNFSNNLKITKKAPNILSDGKLLGRITPARLAETPSSDVFEKTISKEQTFWKNFGFTLPLKDEVLQQLSGIIQDTCKGIFEYEYTPVLKKHFAGTGSKFSGRLKEASSILPKLQRRIDDLEKCHSVSQIYSVVPDLCGFKLTTNGGSKETEKIISKINDLIKLDRFKPTHIINRGKIPYINQEQLGELSNKGFYIIEPKGASNFNCASVYFLDKKHGIPIELQIMGDKTDKINAKEHIFYNYKTKGGATEHGTINEKFQKALDLMTNDEINQYQKYIDDCYSFARAQELNLKSTKPILPYGFDKVLEVV